MLAALAVMVPTAACPVVVCDVAHPQDACVQFFGSDGDIRAARVTVLGARPYLENGQPMPLPQAFAMLEAQAAERQTQRVSPAVAAQRRAARAAANYARHGDPDPWDGDEQPARDVRDAGGVDGGESRLRVEIVKPPVIK